MDDILSELLVLEKYEASLTDRIRKEIMRLRRENEELEDELRRRTVIGSDEE